MNERITRGECFLWGVTVALLVVAAAEVCGAEPPATVTMTQVGEGEPIRVGELIEIRRKPAAPWEPMADPWLGHTRDLSQLKNVHARP